MVRPVAVVALVMMAACGEASDAYVGMRVRVALLTLQDGDGSGVRVDSEAGQVMLHGKVHSQQAMLAAQRMAEEVPGVVRVHNLLQVGPDDDVRARMDGLALQEARRRLAMDERWSAMSVRSVSDGVALLTGRAPTAADHVRAVQRVFAVSGVVRVLTLVTSPSAQTDATLRGMHGQERESLQP